MQLQYEIRKIEAFQISTRVLAVSGSEIKLQLGRNMGIKKGDEYSIIVSETVEGFKNETEHGLVQIKDVGSEVSTGRIVYSSIPVTKDVQLQEIPRLGVDAEGYFHYLTLLGDSVPMPGVRFAASRGFYGTRPYVAIQVPCKDVSVDQWGLFFGIIQISGVVGAEYNAYLGRLTLIGLRRSRRLICPLARSGPGRHQRLAIPHRSAGLRPRLLPLHARALGLRRGRRRILVGRRLGLLWITAASASAAACSTSYEHGRRDLEGLDLAAAKEYIFAYAVDAKRIDKEIAEAKAELGRWTGRKTLAEGKLAAGDQSMAALVQAAAAKVAEFEGKAATLASEREELRAKVERMRAAAAHDQGRASGASTPTGSSPSCR